MMIRVKHIINALKVTYSSNHRIGKKTYRGLSYANEVGIHLGMSIHTTKRIRELLEKLELVKPIKTKNKKIKYFQITEKGIRFLKIFQDNGT